MKLTAQLLATVFPRCTAPRIWASALGPALDRFGITTKARLASFLAQTGHESAQFTRLTENLNYTTPKRLMKVWPKRFPTESSALPFVANEMKLANFVYANRLGNGGVASGDGFRFRGRGLIQITGRSNYRDAGVALDLELVGNPDLLRQPEHAATSAAWFWNSRGLNALADDRTDDSDLEDFAEITRRINGATVGLNERLAVLNQITTLLA